MFRVGAQVRVSPLFLVLVACGGIVREAGPSSEPDGGFAILGSGGQSNGAGGYIGFSAGGYIGPRTAGAPGMNSAGGPGVGGAVGCCLALPFCNSGDEQIPSLEACLPGAKCYQSTACCSTVTCMWTPPVACTVVPICGPGDKQFQGPCPPGYVCNAWTACGTTIQCLHPAPLTDAGPPPNEDAGLTCNPPLEYSRHYVSTDPGTCNTIDYACPVDTNAFSNFCGCGCQQAAGCPRSLNCGPSSGGSSFLCSDSGRAQCPYTLFTM